MEERENAAEKEKILEKTAKEYYSSAMDELEKDRNNSAVVLFFKSIVSLTDLFVLRKTGKTPSSHNERFMVTKEKFSEIYDILDKDFPFYQSSYNILMTIELAEVLKEDAEEIARKLGIKL